MIRAAPTTGMATSEPGYAVWALKVKAATRMAPNPSQVAAAATRVGTLLEPWRSHGHQGSEGQLPGPGEGREVGTVALLWVSMTEKASDAPMTTTRPMARRTRSDTRIRMPAKSRNSVG